MSDTPTNLSDAFVAEVATEEERRRWFEQRSQASKGRPNLTGKDACYILEGYCD